MMNVVDVKVKKLVPEAEVPFYATTGAAGMDVKAVSLEYDEKYDRYIYHTGLAFQLPPGHFMDIRPRSSNTKKSHFLGNMCGVLDSDYTGELLIVYKHRNGRTEQIDPLTLAPYEVGERIAQILIVPYPKINFELVDSLDETERGDGGFGSTGQ